MKIMSVLILMKLMSKGTPDIRSILDLLFPFYRSFKLIPLLAVICPSDSPQTRIVITCFGQKTTVCCPVKLNTLSLTLALDIGGWSTPRHGRFIPGKETRYTLCRRLGGPQGRSGRARKILPSSRFNPWPFQSVANRCPT
jgi:hypothetical protein